VLVGIGRLAAGLHSTTSDLDPFISADRSTLYFDSVRATGCMVLLQSDRPGGVGLQDLYQAVRPL
jgi:hypothetical protein